MMNENLKLEMLSEQNMDAVRAIQREDIPESWVDSADTLWELTQYGLEHNCIGHTYVIKYAGALSVSFCWGRRFHGKQTLKKWTVFHSIV